MSDGSFYGYDPSRNPDHPVIIYEYEWTLIKKRKGYPGCQHNWVYRQARPEGEFIIVHGDREERTSLPVGRMCEDCGLLDLDMTAAEREHVPKDLLKWQQMDLRRAMQ